MSEINPPLQKTGFSKTLVSHAAIYGVGLILVKAGGLLVLPLYWKILTPEDFGLIAIYQLVFQFLSPLFDLGLSGSLQRHLHEWQGQERKIKVGAIFGYSLLFSIVFSIFLFLITPFLSHFLFKADHSTSLILLGVFSCFWQNLINLSSSILRGFERAKVYTMTSSLQFTLQLLLSLFFIFVTPYGLWGYIGAQVISLVVFSLIFIYLIKDFVSWNLSWTDVKPSLAFALPTLPSLILDGIGQSLDRFILEKYAPLGVLGLYNLAKQIGGAYNLILQTMKTSLLPLIYKLVLDVEKLRKALPRLSLIYVSFITVPALLVICLAKDLIYITGKAQYYPIADYIPGIILGFYIQGIGHPFGRGLDLAKKTSKYWIIYAVGVSVSLVSQLTLVPILGVWGAIISFVLGIASRELTQIYLGHRYFPRKVLFDKLAFLAVITVITLCVHYAFTYAEVGRYLSFTLNTLLVGVSALAIGIFCLDIRSIDDLKAKIKG